MVEICNIHFVKKKMKKLTTDRAKAQLFKKI